VQSWVDDQVKANTCAACREMIHWHEIHTHKCRI
jgi:hypothetical protein